MQISQQVSIKTNKNETFFDYDSKNITNMDAVTDISNRISDLVVHFAEGKNTKFAELVGTSEANIRNYRGGKMPKFDFIYKVCEKLEISFDWFILGKGTMFDQKSFHEVEKNDILVLSEKSKTYKTLEKQVIPIYNLKAAAGLVSLFQSPSSFIPVDYISLPNLGKVDGGLYAVGDSMYPLIKSGDIVVYRQIHDILNSIFWGEMYLLSYDLEGEEYIVIKYIQRSDTNGCIKLVSQNQHHSPKDIPVSNVRALAQIKASVRFNTIRPNS